MISLDPTNGEGNVDEAWLHILNLCDVLEKFR